MITGRQEGEQFADTLVPLSSPANVLLSVACPEDVEDEKEALLSHESTSDTIGTKLASIWTAAQRLYSKVIFKAQDAVQDIIERWIDIFTDDDREEKDQLLFQLGRWHGDIVDQAGEPFHETEIMEAVVVDHNHRLTGDDAGEQCSSLR